MNNEDLFDLIYVQGHHQKAYYGQVAEDSHLNFHTAPELCCKVDRWVVLLNVLRCQLTH